jgi:hypothetical protein
VRAIAEWLVCRLAASAKADRSATCEAEWLAGRIYDFKVAFDADGAIIINREFRSGHFSLQKSLVNCAVQST